MDPLGWDWIKVDGIRILDKSFWLFLDTFILVAYWLDNGSRCLTHSIPFIQKLCWLDRFLFNNMVGLCSRIRIFKMILGGRILSSLKGTAWRSQLEQSNNNILNLATVGPHGRILTSFGVFPYMSNPWSKRLWILHSKFTILVTSNIVTCCKHTGSLIFKLFFFHSKNPFRSSHPSRSIAREATHLPRHLPRHVQIPCSDGGLCEACYRYTPEV